MVTSREVSFAQRRLWFLDQFAPGSAVYNNAAAIRVHGPLNRVALEAALDDLVARHEVLRTTFAATDGVPRQVIHDAMPGILHYRDLRSELGPGRYEAALDLAAEYAGKPFALQSGPLLRLMLVRLA